MKKYLLLVMALFSIHTNAIAGADLVDVYRQALMSDPVYQQALAQRLSDRENVPINLAGLLPSLTSALVPSINKTLTSGSGALGRENGTARGYDLSLVLTQTVFDFSKVAGLNGARAIAKQADAILSAATQDLMIRVAKAYFAILQDQDNLIYIGSTRTAYAKQLDQVKQQFAVGLKTITDVYTAQASYETSKASYIAAENQLAVDKENLRAITGVYYPDLAELREDFPLVSPQPADIDAWVTTAGRQNWAIKAAQYAADAARQVINQQYAGHLPTLTAQGSYDNLFTRSSGTTVTSDVVSTSGSSRTKNLVGQFTLSFPILEGGLVVAETRQAKYSYEVALQKLETQLRTTLTQTRQSYLGVLAGISKIAADKQSIKSNISSLEGMEAGYRVGTEILVNVLNQQQNVFQAQQQYAIDRYAFVNNLLALKQAAGTLGIDDLQAINSWLAEGSTPFVQNEPRTETQLKKAKKIIKQTHVTTHPKKVHVQLKKPLTTVAKKPAKPVQHKQLAENETHLLYYTD